MNMPRITIAYAVLLIVLGLGGYFGSGGSSFTALIPAFFGAVVLILGLLALKEPLRKHMLHLAAALGLLGFLGTAGGLAGLFTMVTGGAVERPMATISRSIMALLSLGFFGLCLKTFVDARRAQRQPAGQ